MHVVRAKLHAERTAMTGSTVNSNLSLVYVTTKSNEMRMRIASQCLAFR